MRNAEELKAVIMRVKNKYLNCNDIEVKKLIGRVVEGEISINNRKM